MAEAVTPDILETIRTTAGAALALVGGVLAMIGSVGVIRFPDFYTRMHAASVTDTLGAGLLLVGMMLIAGWSLVTFKLFLILAFLLITSPTSSNAAANAAFRAGLKPMLGKWTGKPDSKDEEG